MSIEYSQANIEVVNDTTSLISLIDRLPSLPTHPPLLYIDIEGIKISRHGSISIISLYVAPMKKTFLIDVHCLGRSTFSTANLEGISLKIILESPTIRKVIFDIRNDSDALFCHYQVSVNGIVDLQLMELASRQGSRDYVAGLAKCIRNDSPLSAAMKQEWELIKVCGTQLFDPKKGGRYEIFNERPMRPEITRYCAQDVALLPQLYVVYKTKLSPPGQAFWRAQVQHETAARIKLSQSASYDPHSKSKAHGPWDKWNIKKATEDWNEDVLFNAKNGDHQDYDYDI